jgi:SNF2 family DNA or RNA helicase
VTLYAFQEDAVRRIMRATEPSYLAFEMGLGKTRMAISVARRRGVKRLLIICPAIGRLVWARELAAEWPKSPPVVLIKTFADVQRLKGDCIAILSYGLVSQSKNGGYDYVAAIKKLSENNPFQMTVLDEAHALKNPAAIRTKSILKRMHPLLGWPLPMSGTPAPNHAGELYPVLRTFWPDCIRMKDGRVMEQHEFEARYCEKVTKSIYDPKAQSTRMIETIEGSKNVDELKARMAPFMIRLRKRDALKELPDMKFDIFPVPVSAKLAAWTKLIPPGSSDDEVLGILKGMDAHIASIRQATGVAKVPGCVEAIMEVLDNTHRKVVVFAHHQSVIDQLVLAMAEYSPVKIDGRDSQSKREEAVDAFLTKSANRVFVGQTQAAGTSLTLVGPKFEVSDVFMVEPSTNPGDNVQAASRIHRIGQKSAVQVWFMTANETFDDRVQDILLRRTQDFSDLFG